MARIRTSVCVIAAPPTGPASSRILLPAATTSSGPIDLDATYPIPPSMSANAEFASSRTGAMGYRESSRSNVRRPSARAFPGDLGGRVAIVLIVEEGEEDEDEDDRLVSDRGGWDAVDRSGGGRSTDIRIGEDEAGVRTRGGEGP